MGIHHSFLHSFRSQDGMPSKCKSPLSNKEKFPKSPSADKFMIQFGKTASFFRVGEIFSLLICAPLVHVNGKAPRLLFVRFHLSKYAIFHT